MEKQNFKHSKCRKNNIGKKTKKHVHTHTTINTMALTHTHIYTHNAEDKIMRTQRCQKKYILTYSTNSCLKKYRFHSPAELTSPIPLSHR